MRKAIVLLLSLTLPLAAMGLVKPEEGYGWSEPDREGLQALVTADYDHPGILKDDIVLRLYPVYPVDDPNVVSSDFGYRLLSNCTQCSRNHQGIDFPLSDRNNEVYAILDGTITRLEYKGEYGLHIYISHVVHTGELGYTSIYAHLRPSNVTDSLSVGDQVYKGQHIGYIGSTGLSTGPHLHFEIHENDDVLDPEEFFDTNLTQPNLKK